LVQGQQRHLPQAGTRERLLLDQQSERRRGADLRTYSLSDRLERRHRIADVARGQRTTFRQTALLRSDDGEVERPPRRQRYVETRNHVDQRRSELAEPGRRGEGNL